MVIIFLSVVKNVYISQKMPMDYQSYVPWLKKVAQTYFDKPIFK